MVAWLERYTALAHFGDWLLAARKKANLTQEELADLAHVSKNYISVLERNLPNYKTGALPNPSRKVLIDISIGLGLSQAKVLQAWAKFGNGESAQGLNAENDAEQPLSLQALVDDLPADEQAELYQIALMRWKRFHPGQPEPRFQPSTPPQTSDNPPNVPEPDSLPEPPPLLLGDTVTIHLAHFSIVTGMTAGPDAREYPISPEIKQEIVTRLTLLHAENEHETQDYAAMLDGWRNNILYKSEDASPPSKATPARRK